MEEDKERQTKKKQDKEINDKIANRQRTVSNSSNPDGGVGDTFRSNAKKNDDKLSLSSS